MLNITRIPAPRVALVDSETGLMSREWFRFFNNIYTIVGADLGVIQIENGGTGLSTAPTNGQLLIGDTVNGYVLNTLNPADGITVTNGAGTITLTNTGVLSFSAGTTGLTPASATNGDVVIGGLLNVVSGGTGQSTYTDGQLLIGNTTGNTLTKSTLTAGTGLTITNGNGAITPSITATGVTALGYGSASNVGTFTVNAQGQLTTAADVSIAINGNQITSGNVSVLYGGTGQTSYTDGQLLIGNSTGNTLTKATLTAGSGVTITNGAGAITINATGSGGTVTSVAALTLGTTGTDLSSTVANGTTTPVITLQVPTASASNRGALSAADWTTFNNKGSGSVTSVGASVPSFLAISGSPITTSGTLAITLSGTALPVANGGTGTATTFTAGSVVFAGASGVYSQKNANFFWDNTNNRLGIGTATPVKTFSVSNSDQNQARIRLENTSGRIYDIVSGVNGLLQSGFSIFDATAAATRFTIFASGGLSIGNTTDPGATNLSVTGTTTSASFIPSSATIPTNGMYLSAANTVGIATNSTNVVTITTAGIGVATTPSYGLHSNKGTTALGLSNPGNNGVYAYWTRPNKSYILALDIGNSGGTEFTFWDNTASVSRMQIGGTGGVSIGNTTDPGAGNLSVKGNILSNGATGVIGYATGSGGAVTQLTSRTTGVTLNKSNGAITLFTAIGAITATTFTVTNSTVAATDTIIVNQKSGTNLYNILVTAVAAGSFNITFYTTGGVASDAPVFNFAVIKAVTA